ncbi:hypothetical protein HYV81_04480 [Candidatus Woesearchaeota archaeon]|nr:hypothetical protein [Candidatus Woesearchaeota archaeon]
MRHRDEKGVEDCCGSHSKEKAGESHESGQGKLRSYIILGMVSLVLLFVVVQAFQINTLRGEIASGASVAGQQSLDISSWSENDKMMYEHHGVLPAGVQQGATPSSSGMVGGC